MRQYRSAGVLCLTEVSSVFSGDHLGVYVRLSTMDFTDVLDISRADLTVQVKGAVAVTYHRFGDGNPWVVVTEDTGIFFVSRRIGGNFTKIQVIFGVSRLQKNDTVLGFQNIFYGSQSLFGQTLFYADFGRTQKPCGSMKILPSSHSFDPTFSPAASYARRNHSPSQPASSTAW